MTTAREAVQKLEALEKALSKKEVAKLRQVTEELKRLKRSEEYQALDLREQSALYKARRAELYDELGIDKTGKLRSGKVTIYTGGVELGVRPCPHCGGLTGMGTIVVEHEDGHRVSISPALYHYAAAGHPITDADVNGEKLMAILADA